jgi:hypothetical protein
MYGGTPWGYIQQKKKTEEVSYRAHSLEAENSKLKKIIKKLLEKKELTDEEKEFVDSLKL